MPTIIAFARISVIAAIIMETENIADRRIPIAVPSVPCAGSVIPIISIRRRVAIALIGACETLIGAALARPVARPIVVRFVRQRLAVSITNAGLDVAGRVVS